MFETLRVSQGQTMLTELKAVYGPRTAGSTSVKSTDGTLLTDRSKILERWADHFQSVLNQDSSFDTQVLSEIPQWPSADNLDNLNMRDRSVA